MRKNGNLKFIIVEIILVLLVIIWFFLLGMTMVCYDAFAIDGRIICSLFAAIIVLAYLFYTAILLGKIGSGRETDLKYPQGEISIYGDKVYLCKEFESENYFANNLPKIFGIFLIAILVSVFFFIMLPVNPIICQLLMWSFVIGFIFWFIHLVDICNWSRQSAFLIRHGRLFYMRLGHTSTISFEDAHVRLMRRDVNAYSDFLQQLLDEYEVVNVVSFHELTDPHIEKQSKDYVWIEYRKADGEMSVMKVRNGYDLTMLDEVTGTRDGTNPVYGYDRIF